MIKQLLFSKFSGLFILVNLVVYYGFAVPKAFSPNSITNVGNWSSAADWSPAGVPSNFDNVTIPTGKTCILDISVTRTGTLTIQPGGKLDANQNFQQNGSASIDVQPGGIFDLSGVRLSLQSSVVTGVLTVDQNTDLYYSGALAGTQTPQMSPAVIKDFFLTSLSNVDLSADIKVNGQMAVGTGSTLNVLSHKLSVREFGFSPGLLNYAGGPTGSELEYFGNLSFTFGGGAIKSLICKTTGTVTLNANTTIASLLYIETGCTVSPASGISITPSGTGFDVMNKGTYNPTVIAATLSPGDGLLSNQGTFFHSGSQTFQRVNNTGIYKIQGSQSLSITNMFTNGSQGQFNPDNTNATVNIAVTGTEVFTNGGKFWGKSNATLLINSSPSNGFVNQQGGIFNFEGNMICQTGLLNSGTFNAKDGQINLAGVGLTLTANSPMDVGRIVNTGNATLAGTSSVNLYDALTISSGTLDLAGKSLVLKSTAAKTARIAAITGVLSNATNVTQERFVNASNSGWYFMGTNIVGQTFADWTDDYDIRGPFPGASFQTTGDHASMFVYDGAVPPTGSDPSVEVNGWRLPTSASVALGKGYRTHLPSKFFLGKKIIDNTGTLHQGPFSFNPTYDSQGYDGGGWNFLANPYPATLDWNSTSWTKTNLNSAIYVFNGATSQYGAYVPQGGHVAGNVYTGTNGVTSMIASGQAFFVRANASSPVLNANEGVKASQSGSFIRSAVHTPTSTFKMSLSNKSNYTDENIIRFDDEGSVDFDQQLDAMKMSGSFLNLSSTSSDGKKLCINTMPYIGEDGYVLPVNVSVNVPESYQLSFTSFEEKAAEMILLLHDKYLNTINPIVENWTYPFSVSADPASQGSGRFEIIMGVDKGVAIKIQDKKPSLITYPNPSLAGNMNVKLVNARPGTSTILVVDALGKNVWNQELDPILNYEFTMPCKLMPGIYFVEVNSGGTLLKSKVLVKE